MLGRKKLTKPNRISSFFFNRRGEKEDRREFGPPTKFPFIDGAGKLVKMDRRCTPDRRISNIQVQEDHLRFDTSRFNK